MSTPKMAQLKKINTRFGEVEYDPQKTIHFPDGLLGFKDLHEFIVMPNKKDGPLFWIQSVDDPQIAFVMTDPTNFFLDYRVIPDDGERAKLGIGKDADCYALTIVSVLPDRTITLNLLAPVLYTPTTNRAIQVILEKSSYKSNTPLPTA
jgi:flagellar assembly factor FliW